MLISCTMSLEFPQPLDSYTEHVGMSSSMSGTIATFFIRKYRPGFLSLGFGSNMTKSDVFIIEIRGSIMSIRSCRLIGFRGPSCSDSGIWVLEDYQIYDDGTWDAIVSRDVNIIVNAEISIDETPMIWNYSDKLTIEGGHVSESNLTGVRTWKLVKGISSSSLIAIKLVLIGFIFIR